MKKIPLLLLPGLLSDAEVWSYQSTNLSDIANIMVPDLNHATTPQEMVAAALNSAPEYFALAGHSMGGWVALEVMKQASERVLGLALLNTTALPDNKEKHEARLRMISEYENGAFASIIEKLLNAFVYNSDIRNQVKSMFERNQSAFVNQEKAMFMRGDCKGILGAISCPTIVIHSRNDMNFKLEDSQLLAAEIKNATLSIIENCGHMSPMESPQDVAELMRVWLQLIVAKG